MINLEIFTKHYLGGLLFGKLNILPLPPLLASVSFSSSQMFNFLFISRTSHSTRSYIDN